MSRPLTRECGGPNIQCGVGLKMRQVIDLKMARSVNLRMWRVANRERQSAEAILIGCDAAE
jgi:hypothetical protein